MAESIKLVVCGNILNACRFLLVSVTGTQLLARDNPVLSQWSSKAVAPGLPGLLGSIFYATTQRVVSLCFLLLEQISSSDLLRLSHRKLNMLQLGQETSTFNERRLLNVAKYGGLSLQVEHALASMDAVEGAVNSTHVNEDLVVSSLPWNSVMRQ
ncbi:hypothetical protein Ancab_034907 [Ancistrocladus abbreviatus]